MATLVVRHTLNPEADALRNWSAWQGTWGTLAQALDAVEDQRKRANEYRDEDETDEVFHARMIGDEVIRQFGEQWAVFHHEGLSAYELGDEADFSSDAEIAAAWSKMADECDGMSGGCAAVCCTHLRLLDGNWHLFRCEAVDFVA